MTRISPGGIGVELMAKKKDPIDSFAATLAGLAGLLAAILFAAIQFFSRV